MDLSKKEVANLVGSDTDSGVTDTLYNFGSSLVSEIQERASAIDSKATTILSWSTAILAFLFAESSNFSTHPEKLFLVSATCFGVFAVIFSFWALRSRNQWEWPGDDLWFPSPLFSSADMMKRHYVCVFHAIKTSHRKLTEEKGRMLSYGEFFLMISALLLGAGIASRFFPLIYSFCRVHFL
jgi:hypothetical protein